MTTKTLVDYTPEEIEKAMKTLLKRKAHDAGYYQEHKEEKAEHYQEHKEEKAEHNQQYYQKNKTKMNEQNCRWRKANPEKVVENNKKYYQENKTEMNEQNRRWRKEKPEKDKETQRLWHEEHREEQTVYNREWRQAHRGRANELSKLSRQRNLSKRLEYSRRRYQENKERILEENRQYALTHPEVRKAVDHKRRAESLGSDGHFTPEEWKRLCNDYENRCVYCNLELPLTADHMIPLSKGGDNKISNIVPSCRSCNSRKYTKTYEEFMEEMSKEVSSV